MTKCDILIRNCKVLTKEFEIKENCSAAIADTRIQAVGDAAEINGRYYGDDLFQAVNRENR